MLKEHASQGNGSAWYPVMKVIEYLNVMFSLNIISFLCVFLNARTKVRRGDKGKCTAC